MNAYSLCCRYYRDHVCLFRIFDVDPFDLLINRSRLHIVDRHGVYALVRNAHGHDDNNGNYDDNDDHGFVLIDTTFVTIIVRVIIVE